jgi:transcriptional regulator
MKTQATKVTGSTLLGIGSKNFPLKNGNCFDVEVNGQSCRVINFVLENLEHLIETNIVSWPIDVELHYKDYVSIKDVRIPKDYYRETLCTICTPIKLREELSK